MSVTATGDVREPAARQGSSDGAFGAGMRKAATRINIRRSGLGTMISTRKHSDVYNLGEDQVVKLFSRNVPIEDIEREHHVAITLHDRGLPVPASEERLARCEDGRHGIIFERITGSTIKSLYRKVPWKTVALTQRFAGAHEQSFGIDTLDGLRSQRLMLRAKIARASAVTLRERQKLLAILDGLPDAGLLCHGNFQPGKVVIKPNGEMVYLGWGDACIGNPASDIARTALILGVPGRGDRRVASSLVASGYGSILKRIYLQSAMRQRPDLVEQMPSWLAINAAVRMEESISLDQRVRLAKLVRSVLAQDCGADRT